MKTLSKRRAPKTVPHVVKEGSRQHVIHWDTKGRHCSCRECEVNAETRRLNRRKARVAREYAYLANLRPRWSGGHLLYGY